ncbi:ERAD-associated E3 ubiquitin-protein ligase HRD1A [Aspergillus lentulus]|uniref:RING-type E3 ubiquitin transferase n=1 Tax=Aspergillus lentulus TaxID=293939 RepID=A0AAN4PRZ6_ASPLE|nr:ERAD-associated E3 ubiquitin-protein ligase HRD1A [Aspergillus lentulus]
MRLAAYAGASTALATAVVLKALHQRANFYAACVYLSQSSANLMILTNLCLLVVGILLFWLQRLLYGPLRPIETEQLYEKAWFAVTETCLAMTIFRGELGGWFLVMFVCLLVGKVWGWIGEGRVEFLEQQPPANPRLFHTRLAISLVLAVLFDSLMLKYCITTVLEQARPDMMVMFGFEFAVLTILSSSTAARYTISLVELYITRQQIKAKVEERRREIRAAREAALHQNAQTGETPPASDLPDENDIDEMELDVPGWEEKGRWIFYLDLLTDFFKLTVYLSFFAILFMFYGLPIHILRDVVVTIRSFGRRIMDFVRYRNATRDMNERYPDATPEEVAREDVCIICREEMAHWQEPAGAGEGGAAPAQPRPRMPERLRPKKLPCGHILHFSCLRSWLERQQNCPTCRRPVMAPPRDRDHPPGNINLGQGNGGAGPQPNVPVGNQPFGQNGPADNLPRARIFQFGPFRIGFGAGRGDLFRNFHQQIHQGNVPAQQANNAIPPGARQIGFGLGFGRPIPAPVPQALPTNTPSNFVQMQNQLHQIELQIMQEINSLRVTAEQLHHVRLLQAELQRLRNPPAASSDPNTTISPASTFQPSSSLSATLRRQFTSDPQASAIPSGDSRLPEGLSLPEGWSLIPLQSAGQGPSGISSPIPTTAPEPSPTVQVREEPSFTENSAPAASMNGKSSGTVDAARSTTSSLPDWGSETPATATHSDIESSSRNSGKEVFGEPSEKKELSAWDNEATNADESPESSSSKGKARVVTVEDAADEEA